jgi:4-amino-4-deoxy-L-arabinose transferase-like glycosyltransferase
MKRALLASASVVGLFFLYFFGISRTGLIGPDEPRYADIGRAMAVSGDWITPHLWGTPWFEKPALLYWMTASGFKLGLGTEWAPRLPVALASVAFLLYFFVVLRREFGSSSAWFASAILATSAGWIVYSRVAITDIPLAAAFGAAMLIILPAAAGTRSFVIAGALLGLAILAKGLVPLVLFIPALWFFRHRIRDLAILFGVASLVAAPWFALVTLRNGPAFLDEFFWKQHFGRFLNSTLQHERPIWFYVPVLLAGLFPWTPLLWLSLDRALYRDRRAQFLLAWFAWGFLFFSASRNKLPGYLLPLLPPVAALLGIALASGARSRILLAASALLLTLGPAFSGMLPQALAAGISHTPIHPAWLWLIAGVAFAIVIEFCSRRLAVGLIAASTTLFVAGVAWSIYPVLDRDLSGRNIGPVPCMPQTSRSQRYSIEYYAGKSIADCK